MNRTWQRTFRKRMHGFSLRRPPGEGEVAVSVKVRVTSGCFHREHSPEAYAVIDRHLDRYAGHKVEFDFEEHESGPEILVCLALATAGTTLLKSVVDLVTAIIKARSRGVRKGDGPRDPLELVVRRVSSRNEVTEEVVLRVGHTDPVDRELVEAALRRALADTQHRERKPTGGTPGRSAKESRPPTPEPRGARASSRPQRRQGRGGRHATG
jgi:hypothetical protein